MKKPRSFEDRLKVSLRSEEPAGGKGAGGKSKKPAGKSHSAAAEFQTALRVHDAEIKHWLAADPARIAALRKNPKAIMLEMIAHLGITVPNLSDLVSDDTFEIDFDIAVSTGGPSLGSALLQQVWRHISANRTNAAAFRKDPEGTVRSVAAAQSASATETTAVVRAVLIAMRRNTTAAPATGVVQNLDRIVARAGLMREPSLSLRIRR